MNNIIKKYSNLDISIENLKHNWYFVISAMAYFCLNFSSNLGYVIGMAIAFLIHTIIFAGIPSPFNILKNNRITFKVLSFLTAVGICLGAQCHFNTYINEFIEYHSYLPQNIFHILTVIGIIGTVVSIPFIYFMVSFFYKKMADIIFSTDLLKDIKKGEIIFYILLIFLFAIYVTIVFSKSVAFYGAKYYYDNIYTTDSPISIEEIGYLSLTYFHNDIRKPLFAVFAAPFIGIPYLIGRLFSNFSIQAIFMNYIQIIMLFAANFMLAKLMNLNTVKRICFMILMLCTYTSFLFMLAMEQYIIAYFWLVFCIYLICKRNQPERIAMYGAGGTLLTSMILLPYMSETSPFKNFKKWFSDMLKCGFEFVILILTFCRFDVIFNVIKNIKNLIRFTGKDLTFYNKLCQYTEFIKNYFISPNAGIIWQNYDHISWQLKPITSINIAGVVILLLVVLSAVFNRDKKSSRISILWTGFSVVILVLLGWGTQENGLFLYSLYFGWSFLVLLFQLAEKIEDKMHTKYIIPIFTAACVIIMLALNIPAIAEMLNFAITYYPN